MKSRNEAASLFIEFQTAAERFCNEKIAVLRVDNTPELIRGQLQNHCKSQGIAYEKTVPDSPSQNGVAERTNLTICSMARAMLIDSDLRDFFWPFAVLTAVHIKQRLPHASLPPNTTPFELWFHRRPNLSHLRPFGASCTARILANHKSKFHPRGETGRFLGYAKDAKGYLVWVPNAENNGGSLKVRRDVIFHHFPDPPLSPNNDHEYLPLWDNVGFPDRLNVQNHHPPLTSYVRTRIIPKRELNHIIYLISRATTSTTQSGHHQTSHQTASSPSYVRVCVKLNV